jgi:hypothetical protein
MYLDGLAQTCWGENIPPFAAYKYKPKIAVVSMKQVLNVL